MPLCNAKALCALVAYVVRVLGTFARDEVADNGGLVDRVDWLQLRMRRYGAPEFDVNVIVLDDYMAHLNRTLRPEGKTEILKDARKDTPCSFADAFTRTSGKRVSQDDAEKMTWKACMDLHVDCFGAHTAKEEKLLLCNPDCAAVFTSDDEDDEDDEDERAYDEFTQCWGVQPKTPKKRGDAGDASIPVKGGKQLLSSLSASPEPMPVYLHGQQLDHVQLFTHLGVPRPWIWTTPIQHSNSEEKLYLIDERNIFDDCCRLRYSNNTQYGRKNATFRFTNLRWWPAEDQ
jgi:hypothetical protein